MIQLIWYNLPKSGYFLISTKIWTLPCVHCTCVQWAWVGAGSKNFLFTHGFTQQEAMLKNFGICFAHLKFLPKLSFLSATQLAIFRIEYNTFQKRQIWLIFKINFQIIIIEEKTQFELNLTSFKLILACGDLSAITWLDWENMTKIRLRK